MNYPDVDGYGMTDALIKKGPMEHDFTLPRHALVNRCL